MFTNYLEKKFFLVIQIVLPDYCYIIIKPSFIKTVSVWFIYV